MSDFFDNFTQLKLAITLKPHLRTETTRVISVFLLDRSVDLNPNDGHMLFNSNIRIRLTEKVEIGIVSDEVEVKPPPIYEVDLTHRVEVQFRLSINDLNERHNKITVLVGNCYGMHSYIAFLGHHTGQNENNGSTSFGISSDNIQQLNIGQQQELST